MQNKPAPAFHRLHFFVNFVSFAILPSEIQSAAALTSDSSFFRYLLFKIHRPSSLKSQIKNRNEGSHFCLGTRPKLLKTFAMSPPEKLDKHSDQFLYELMRKQLRLSLGCAATFLVVLLGLPLANYFFPQVMATRVFGFTLTWLVLGLGFFPVVWAIAWVFIRKSIALEQAEAALVSSSRSEESVASTRTP
jgi:uncharacterized membrane protein (DUF485 family)